MKIEVNQGDRYGRLTIIREVEPHNSRRYFMCRCDCGNERAVPLDTMRQGKARSCGCYAQEAKRTHGKTNSRVYNIWRTMKRRCNCETHINFKDYGGRGITVCPEWRDSFEAFNVWAMANGYDDSLTIDRIDVDGDYEPSNCRWTTMKVQQNNRRNNTLITHNGETRTLKEWSEVLGMSKTTLRYRLKGGGWNIDNALSKTVNHYDRHQ